MNRIEGKWSGAEPLPFPDAKRASSGVGQDEISGRSGNVHHGLGHDRRSGQFELGTGHSSDSEHAFAQKMRLALGTSADDEPSESPQPRLLAAAGEIVNPLLLRPIPPTSGGEKAYGRLPEVDAMVDRIEKSLAAAASGEKCSEISIRLDLSSTSYGISGVTISMSRDSIDVVLTRTGLEMNSEFLQATQRLADKLQSRFSRRVVRVHDVGGMEQARLSASGLDEISKLFKQSGTDT